jgi:hypothetical protein
MSFGQPAPSDSAWHLCGLSDRATWLDGFGRAIFDVAGRIASQSTEPGTVPKCLYGGLTDPLTHWLNTVHSRSLRFAFQGVGNVSTSHFPQPTIDGDAGWTGDSWAAMSRPATAGT